jgi:hypothetical protein
MRHLTKGLAAETTHHRSQQFVEKGGRKGGPLPEVIVREEQRLPEKLHPRRPQTLVWSKISKKVFMVGEARRSYRSPPPGRRCSAVSAGWPGGAGRWFAREGPGGLSEEPVSTEQGAAVLVEVALEWTWESGSSEEQGAADQRYWWSVEAALDGSFSQKGSCGVNLWEKRAEPFGPKCFSG